MKILLILLLTRSFGKYSNHIKEELYSAAKEGLCYAATKYDSFQDNCKFISYAVNWVRYYINEELLFEYADPQPLVRGWFGFRTTWSHCRLRNFRVVDSAPE